MVALRDSTAVSLRCVARLKAAFEPQLEFLRYEYR
jgi:hypothetical protein